MNHAHAHTHGCCGHDHKHQSHDSHLHGIAGHLRLFASELLSGLLLAVGLIFAPRWSSGFALAYYIVAILPVAWVIISDGLPLWRKGDLMNEFTLMTLTAIGAFAIGEYPEGVAVLLFYSFGEKLMDRAGGDVKQRIKHLVGRMPEKVTIEAPDGLRSEVSPREVAVGSVIAVKPGERVALDSHLLSETPVAFDTAALTGESVPRTFSNGDIINAGLIPIDREVRMRTVKAYAESTMSRILRMIEDASARKTPTETMLRRVTRWFTPTVIILALLVFAVPAIVAWIGGSHFDAAMWFRRSLVFFVCSCPCALVVSIPLSYFAALGNAASRGLLFKGAPHIDMLRSIDTVAFDKTGTITTGEFTVSSVIPLGSFTEDDILAIAAAVEAESSHPLARAILQEARARRLSIPKASDITTVKHGMTAVIDGKPVSVGSRKRLNINKLPEPGKQATEIIVAVGTEAAGMIYLSDTIKPEAAQAIEQIHRLGISSVAILSGDNANAVEQVASAVGADTFEAAMMPEEKYRHIETLRNEGHTVAFVGDGINDAPALSAASLGVAMGAMGTDMAVESADLVIAADRLDKLAEGISLSRRVRRVVFENVVFAFSVKGIVMLLAALGIATLWAGVFADTGVTLVTILWTLLRLRR